MKSVFIQSLKNSAVFAVLYLPAHYAFAGTPLFTFTAGAMCALVISHVADAIFPYKGA